MNKPAPLTPAVLARQVREQFAGGIQESFEALSTAVGRRLMDLVDNAPSTREAHQRRDAMLQYERLRPIWLDAMRKAFARAVEVPSRAAPQASSPGGLRLELIGDDVVEKKIIASRLAMALQEKVTWELNDLKVRMQELEGDDLGSDDFLLPDALAQLVIEQWMDCGLPRPTWLLVGDLVQQQLVPVVLESYRRANQTLISAGVLPKINLSNRVKRGGGPARRAPGLAARPELGGDSQPGPLGAPASNPASDWGNVPQPGWGPGGGQDGASRGSAWGGGTATHGGAAGGPQVGFGGGQGAVAGPGMGAGGLDLGPMVGGGSAGGYTPGVGGGAGPGSGFGGNYAGGAGGASGPDGFPPIVGMPGEAAGPRGGSGPAPSGGFFGGGAAAPGGYAPGASGPLSGGAGAAFQGVPGAPGGFTAPGGAGPAAPSAWNSGQDDTRLMTGNTPLARARARAQGVIGQLKRLLTERVAGFQMDEGHTPSPALTQALTVQASHIQTRVQEREDAIGGVGIVYDSAEVQQVARDLRERTGELKKQATTSSEKAVIEIVALMFQSILAEERIPPAVRVWFARLQMPVLRVALSEPEFFESLQHPARQLIDRMGSCVLGFDASAIGGSALEGEIRRVVQLIEQYPETGRKVFLLAYEEFQKFLSRFLTEKGATQRLVTVAQQVEQKETMAVRYTIELRKMLDGMPVREEIRDFLFKVWAEVLAVAAVKNGPQHAETLALKKSASELVWAASAKPNRAERAQVIQGLPGLLQRLRQGMSLMGMEGTEQEGHIKAIGDTLADAFQSKTASIPQARIEAIAQRLANIEDTVGEDPEGDLPLVAESIELMLGLDNSGIEVITTGGTTPGAAMVAWARELQPGTWFSLDHNGQVHQVQYAWRSERGQLHLFASTTGHSFLIQAGRLAAYLQAGLVRPTEEEALTVRATRDALAKLDANPERLLA